MDTVQQRICMFHYLPIAVWPLLLPLSRLRHRKLLLHYLPYSRFTDDQRRFKYGIAPLLHNAQGFEGKQKLNPFMAVREPS